MVTFILHFYERSRGNSVLIIFELENGTIIFFRCCYLRLFVEIVFFPYSWLPPEIVCQHISFQSEKGRKFAAKLSLQKRVQINYGSCLTKNCWLIVLVVSPTTAPELVWYNIGDENDQAKWTAKHSPLHDLSLTPSWPGEVQRIPLGRWRIYFRSIFKNCNSTQQNFAKLWNSTAKSRYHAILLIEVCKLREGVVDF